jgi:hypothetical protein
MAGGEVVSDIVMIPGPHVEIGEFRISIDGRTHVQCRTCGYAVSHGGTSGYGTLLFTPMQHDPHCPARHHVYLEGIGPMIEPRAMVPDKGGGGSDGRGWNQNFGFIK